MVSVVPRLLPSGTCVLRSGYRLDQRLTIAEQARLFRENNDLRAVGLALEIFRAVTRGAPAENWAEACVTSVITSNAEPMTRAAAWRSGFADVLRRNLFMPRAVGSGTDQVRLGGFLNCFVTGAGIR